MEENKNLETTQEENTEEVKEEAKAIEDENNPLAGNSIQNIEAMLKAAEQMVQIMESQWMDTAKEFKITDSHMKQIAVYNDEHKTPMPDDISEEDAEKWDHLNGLNDLTRDDAIKIFGEDSPIIGIDDTHTRDRVKGAADEFYQWVYSMNNYRSIHDAYLKLLEMEEEKEIEELRKNAEAETDEEAKKKKLEAVDNYYRIKYLDFLADPIEEKEKGYILRAFKDEKMVERLINRTRDKLRQLKISQKFILEISQFEVRFLEEKYHKCNNLFLIYFMNRIIYKATVSNKKDVWRSYIVSIIMGMDSVIRKQWDEEKIERVLNNIRALEDQFIDDLPDVEEEHHVAEPIKSE